MTKTILVSGASGIVGYGILRSLSKSDTKYRLVSTSVYKESVAPAFSDIFELAPYTNSNGYLDWLISVIRKHNVSMVIPSIEADMYLWNRHRAEIDANGAIPLLNSSSLIDLCQDKWVFYSQLKDIIPRYLIPTSNLVAQGPFDYPFILKPRIGFGSKGIIRIHNAEQYALYKESVSDNLIVQPIIGSDDEEYTVSAFFDRNHRLIDYQALRRKLSINGYTEIAQVASNDFTDALSEIGSAVNPIGPTNFQFRLDNGIYKLLEINPRISSSTSIRAACGYNESLMSAQYFLNNLTPERHDKQASANRKVVRYVEDCIL